jgi:phage I-like protein
MPESFPESVPAKNCMLFDSFDELLSLADTSESGSDRKIPTEVTLAKWGVNKYTKGGERGEYDFAEADADRVIADFTERGRDVVFDYEHETLSGHAAPASGWIGSLKKTTVGLVATMKSWTETAKGYLSKGEYRYHSPVFYISRRRPLALHSVALTNHHATHNQEALVPATDDPATNDKNETHERKDKEDMNDIAKALGIVALADDTDGQKLKQTVLDTVTGLVALKDEKDGFLKLHDAKTFEELTLKVKGMVPAADKALLESKLAQIDAEKAVALAMTDGKVTEAMKPAAIAFALKDPVLFADYVAKSATQAPGAAPTLGTSSTTPEVLPLTDDGLGKEFAASAALQAEFKGDKAAYVAFKKNDAAGRIHIVSK